MNKDLVRILFVTIFLVVVGFALYANVMWGSAEVKDGINRLAN